MSTSLSPAAAPAVAALEHRLEELLRACKRLAAENRSLHLRAGQLENELATARSLHASDTDTLRRQCETIASERDQRHMTAIAELDALHEARLDAVRESLEAELAEACAAAAHERSELEAAHAQVLAAAHAAADTEIAELHEQLAAARQRIGLMVARLRALEV